MSERKKVENAMKTNYLLRGGVRLPSKTLAAGITLAAHNQTTVK